MNELDLSVGLRPTGGDGRYLVRRDPDASERNGIVIPIMWRTKDQTGTVLAVHNGIPTADGVVRPPCCAVGDRVLFSKYAGTDIQWEGETLTIMREDDMYAVIED